MLAREEEARVAVNKFSRSAVEGKRSFQGLISRMKVPRVIAERLLHIAGAKQTVVTVRIYEPEMRPADAVDADIPWMCAIELDGMPTRPGFPTRMHVGQGLDSLDALVNALFVVRCVLDVAERKLGIQCVWPVIEHRQGGHAVPTPIMTELGPTMMRTIHSSKEWVKRRRYRRRYAFLVAKFRPRRLKSDISIRCSIKSPQLPRRASAWRAMGPSSTVRGTAS
jgi:hypothetical protein